MNTPPLDVLTWHIHGSYLNYLAYSRHNFWVPALPGRPARFAGRPADATWPPNVREIPAHELCKLDFDAILYQHEANWSTDRHRWLTELQLSRIPQAFLEHNPPRQSPTDTCHVVDDPNVPVVHVTHFNKLMWDCGRSPSVVIEHGVCVPEDAVWNGASHSGITAVNNITSRGRQLGPDVLQAVSRRVPVELVGIGSEAAGGRGEIPHHRIAYEYAKHRFFLNPIRYTSLGLAVLEAMAVGTPVIGLATTEMSVAVDNGVNGFVHTDVEKVTDFARELVTDMSLARTLSAGARERARENYGIERFAADWDGFLRDLAS